jgi:hypothetical protein
LSYRTSLASCRTLCWYLNNTEARITIGSQTNITGYIDRSVNAVSKRTGVDGTWILIIACIRSKDTSRGTIAGIKGTVVTIITNDGWENTASIKSAKVHGTKIAVVTNLGDVETFGMGHWIALESKTCIGLRASTIGTRSTIGNGGMHATKDHIASIRGTSIEVVAIDGSKGAANLKVAGILGTDVVVVTDHWLKDTGSIESITYGVIAFVGRIGTGLGFINTSSSCGIA